MEEGGSAGGGEHCLLQVSRHRVVHLRHLPLEQTHLQQTTSLQFTTARYKTARPDPKAHRAALYCTPSDCSFSSPMCVREDFCKNPNMAG